MKGENPLAYDFVPILPKPRYRAHTGALPVGSRTPENAAEAYSVSTPELRQTNKPEKDFIEENAEQVVPYTQPQRNVA